MRPSEIYLAKLPIVLSFLSALGARQPRPGGADIRDNVCVTPEIVFGLLDHSESPCARPRSHQRTKQEYRSQRCGYVKGCRRRKIATPRTRTPVPRSANESGSGTTLELRLTSEKLPWAPDEFS
jgi:hypothetical protein